MAKKEQLLDLIKNFINYVERLSDEDLEKISAKEATIKYQLINKNTTPHRKIKLFKSNVSEPIDVEGILKNLNEFDSREAGEAFLTIKCPNRIQMEKVAKKLDIPFQKKDRNELLRNKIIEGTIGYRLRSQAIQTSEKALKSE